MSKIRFILLALFFFVVSCPAVRAEEIKVVFTGQSFASLYPCHCPHSPEGGVARRATAIKKIRASAQDVLIVEAGSLVASGPQDQQALNSEADLFRSQVYLEALGKMGYDVYLVDRHDLALGDEFFKKNEGMPFISSNQAQLHPYAIKRFKTFSVGILGLTDRPAAQGADARWQSPDKALEQGIKELKSKGVNFIILLSSLKPDEDKALVKKVKGVSLVINGSPSFGSVNLVQENGVIFLTTWWQARQIGVLTLDINGRKVSNKGLTMVRLSPEIADDPDVAALLPSCFNKGDCKSKVGQTVECRNAGTKNAVCVYTGTPKVHLTVIRPKTCHTCRIQEFLDNLKTILGESKVEYLSVDSPQAKKIIEEFKIAMLPAYLLDKDFKEREDFATFENLLQKGERHYLFKQTHAGVSYIIGRHYIPKRLDVFLNLRESTPALFKLLKDFDLQHPDVDIRIHYLAIVKDSNEIVSKGGAGEVEEFKRCACIDESDPAGLLDYLACRSSDKPTSLWENCALKSRLDPAKIKACAGSEQGRQALLQRIQMNEELEIVKNPTFVVDNTEIFGMVQIPTLEEFERTVLGTDNGPKEKAKKNN